MTSASVYLSKSLLNHAFGGGSHNYTPAGTLYCALFEAGTLLDAGTLTDELANSNNYSRQTITFRDDDGTALPTTTGAIENAATVSFEASGGDWATATHVAILDSGTHGAGNVLAWGAMDSSRTVLDGQRLDFTAGTLRITLT